jgi:hypothetical protein
MMARVAEDTKIANGTKRAAKGVGARPARSVTLARLTEIRGAKHTIKVHRDSQANNTP